LKGCAQWAVPLTLALLLACGSPRPPQPAGPAVESSVRAFAQMVARDVTQDGPIAWRKYFLDSPSFFMAVNGALAFPNGAAAQTALPEVARAIKKIELQWGGDLRVDPLAPGLAVMAASYHEVRLNAGGDRVVESGFFTAVVEQRDGRWQFRNQHWSAPLR
jgi:hypothetical protein